MDNGAQTCNTSVSLALLSYGLRWNLGVSWSVLAFIVSKEFQHMVHSILYDCDKQKKHLALLQRSAVSKCWKCCDVYKIRPMSWCCGWQPWTWTDVQDYFSNPRWQAKVLPLQDSPSQVCKIKDYTLSYSLIKKYLHLSVGITLLELKLNFQISWEAKGHCTGGGG